jgi:predicted nuclease with TOPRIM domain
LSLSLHASVNRSMPRVPDESIARIKRSMGIQNPEQPIKIEGHQAVPDDQHEIKTLKEALAHKTRLCHRIEDQKGRLTMDVNKLQCELDKREDENELLNEAQRSMGKRIHDLQMQVDVYKSIALLKQMQEETQRTAEILSATLAEERTHKRPRHETVLIE